MHFFVNADFQFGNVTKCCEMLSFVRASPDVISFGIKCLWISSPQNHRKMSTNVYRVLRPVPTAYSGSMSSSAAAPTLPPYFASELTEPTRHWRYRLAHGNGLAEIRLEQTGCQRGTGPRPSVPQIEKRPRPEKSRGR